jgi:predicted nucleic acid-binding protein
MRYLVDTSAFARMSEPAVASVLTPLAAQGQLVLCGPVIFELMFSAQTGVDADAMDQWLASFRTAPTNDADMQRALDVQRQAVRQGHHRALSLTGVLVAAIAEARELTVLHYDGDYELIAAIAQQSTRCVVPAGTAD